MRLLPLPGAALWLLAGCAAEPALPSAVRIADTPPAPAGAGANVTQLAGALLLHEFPAGGHGSLLVVDKPIDLGELDGREPFTVPYPTVLREGPCRLYQQARCVPGCAVDQFCRVPQVCEPLPKWPTIDIGDIRVTGSTIAPLIRMWFAGADSPYDADPPPGPAKLYAGGERLLLMGGSGAYTLHASFLAPAPVVVLSPDPQAPFHLPVAAPLPLRWQPAGGALMVIVLIASRQGLDWANIRCLVPDSGEFTVPKSLIAALPPPPRSLRFELERDEEVLQPLPELGPSVGMLAHAAFTAWQNGEDP